MPSGRRVRSPPRARGYPNHARWVGPLTLHADRQYPPRMGIRLVLAEDNVLTREGVRALIELEDDLKSGRCE